MNPYMQAALKLHQYIQKTHWNGEALLGPDPGLRFHSRIWRFFKSYLRFIAWKDYSYFLQCQGYWNWNNWKLFDLTKKSSYKEIAIACTDSIIKMQTQGGYWEYPLPEWKKKIATVEGDYAAFGLLETYKHTKEKHLLEGVIKWYDFLIDQTGFQIYKDSKCINYFAGQNGRLVPNNTTLTLELFSELYQLTRNKKYLKTCDDMIQFLYYVQRESGEFPYAFETPDIQGRGHFLCYQYNAFQFLDLVHYWENTKDTKTYDILHNLIRYLQSGLHPNGHSRYNCRKAYPEVTYYTAVLGAAFLKAKEIGLGDYEEYENKAYRWVLKRQNKKGGFIYSSRNYGILSDRRSYPRYLCMILKHLLMKSEKEKNHP